MSTFYKRIVVFIAIRLRTVLEGALYKILLEHKIKWDILALCFDTKVSVLYRAQPPPPNFPLCNLRKTAKKRLTTRGGIKNIFLVIVYAFEIG